MNWKEHQKADLIQLGEKFPEVHRWMDGMAQKWFKTKMPYGHWTETHHLEAVEAHFGGRQLESAKLHILMDWAGHWGIVHLPRTKQEVIDKLAKFGAVVAEAFREENKSVWEYRGVEFNGRTDD